MQILSHRGYWKRENEKNQVIAFERSFSLGFGTETDVRDYNGDLVISHDIASDSCMTIDSFFQLYNRYEKSIPLALNIKADGLQQKLRESLKKYNIKNYFVFDMSVPDTIGYLEKNINIFTRQSEYEREPALYNEAAGVWMDSFLNEWMEKEDIFQHLENGKKVCIVSPDLHKREHRSLWRKLSNMPISNYIDIMLCTDYPEEAMEYFYGKN